jgi:signal transduction histidine kinase
LPLIEDRDLGVFQDRIERGKRGLRMNGLEVPQRRKDGSSLTISMWTAPLRGPSGAVTGFIALAADASERRLFEERLRQSHKMEAVGRLAGGVAHDFNNLLTVITGYGYMLLDEVGNMESARASVEEILRTVERASALTSQLLTFSRHQVARPVVLDLATAVANMDRMLRRVIGEDIELVAELSAEPGKVRADPAQIEQVILNLVVNARDAMPSGGRITIRTANLEIRPEYTLEHPAVAPGPYILLSVADTGQGMDDDTKAHLFEPFFTTKEHGKGTGLVEDEDAVRKLVHDVLSQHGYVVLQAAHPDEALERSRSHAGKIDLLLTDVVMPRMSGRELADRLAPARAEMKVLFISGYTEDAVVARCPQSALLKKPFTPAALAHKVRAILENRQ